MYMYYCHHAPLFYRHSIRSNNLLAGKQKRHQQKLARKICEIDLPKSLW